jgi:hypothetical protein
VRQAITFLPGIRSVFADEIERFLGGTPLANELTALQLQP